MNANPVEVVNIFGQYGGILGVIVAALLAIIIFNMYLGYKRQSKFDDRMLEAVDHSRRAMNNLANAVGRLPCTVMRDPKLCTRESDRISLEDQ